MRTKILRARRAGYVTRYHAMPPLVRPESVATHTFNMMNILMVLTGGALAPEVLKYALLHDQGEYVSGDLMSPVKKAMGPEAASHFEKLEEQAIQMIHRQGLPKLTEYQYNLVKLADNLDGLLKCMEEIKLGNVVMHEVARNYVLYIKKLQPAMGSGDIMAAAMDFVREYEEKYGE